MGNGWRRVGGAGGSRTDAASPGTASCLLAAGVAERGTSVWRWKPGGKTLQPGPVRSWSTHGSPKPGPRWAPAPGRAVAVHLKPLLPEGRLPQREGCLSRWTKRANEKAGPGGNRGRAQQLPRAWGAGKPGGSTPGTNSPPCHQPSLTAGPAGFHSGRRGEGGLLPLGAETLFNSGNP